MLFASWLMLKSLLLQSVIKETLEDLSAELQVKKLKTSNQPSLHNKITDLKLINVSITK